MIKFIDVTGKTEDEAIQSALAQLKMDRDDVSVEILERAKAGFLGIGSAPARVRVSYDDGKAEEVKLVEKPAAPKPEKKVEPASAPKAVPMYTPEVLQKKESRANDKPRTERGDRPAREDRRENRAPRAERAERPAPQPKPIVDLGEECHDEKSEQIRAFLKGLLEHMDSAAEVKVYESEKGRYKVFLEGEKLGALIGRRGETMESLSYLASLVANRLEGDYIKLGLDVAGYRDKRENDLTVLAQRIGNKVRKTGRSFAMEPMNPYERRIIHSAISKMEGVRSESKGEGRDRRVVIYSTAPDAQTDNTYGERRPRGNGRRPGGNRNGGFRGGRGSSPRNGGPRNGRPAGSRGPRPSSVPERTYAPRDAETAAPVAPKRTERVDDFADFSFGKIEL